MKQNRGALVAGVVVIVLLGGLLWWFRGIMSTPAPDLGGGDVEVEIREGMTLNGIASLLEQERLIESRGSFKWAARLMGAERKLQPGWFLLPRGATNVVIIRYLLRPGILTKDVTIPEGLTVKQTAETLAVELGLDSVEFVALCNDSLFAAELGVNAGRLEGYLFPDTYNFYRDGGERGVIRRMVQRFFEVCDDSLRAGLPAVGLNLHQAVTLASIIQGEVMVASEAPLVSAVYHNRLKRRIPLAADPTIQYILPDGPRRLLNRDLELESPYNTYKHRGLPPGPINNPGRVALEAAVNPADADYIYFVAKGDGTHAFNSTHAGHIRDKRKFQQVRREVARREKGMR